MNAADIRALLPYMTEAERAEVFTLLSRDTAVWRALPGPQTNAYLSDADIVVYGGAAGGGKSSLACGLALTAHRKSIIFRRNGTELTGILDEMTRILGTRDGYNGQDKIWRINTPDGVPRQVEFGSFPNPGDERKFQGRDHDLIVYDEAANMPEAAVRFLMGWLRTATPGQRCRVLLTTNPPTNAEGRWVVAFAAPWLDPMHPNPAKPGELRYFATVEGKDIEMPDGRPFVLADGEPCYDFDATSVEATAIIKPLSRTFIPSRITDNPYLTETGYMSTLQALPEPLRSQMLNGDFNAGISDDPWQVIPTSWVEAAMERWRKLERKPRMDSLGIDVARGGKDQTVIARRHGYWFDEPLAYPGAQTPDGPTVAGLVIAATRDKAPQHIDVIGIGASPYDFLKQSGQQVTGVNVAEKALGTDKSGRLTFPNQRSELWWRMREMLDPTANNGAALPPDPRLRADLCAPTWSLRGAQIYVESREEIIKRIGRSPDFASAYILAAINTPREGDLFGHVYVGPRTEYDPYAQGGAVDLPRHEHNPYA